MAVTEPSCLFCRIVAGEEPAHEVLRTDSVVAFLDIRPVFAGHTLVVPVEHVDTLPDLASDRLGDYFGAVQTLSRAIPEALGSQGTWVSINNVVSQSVPHLHTHLVPAPRATASAASSGRARSTPTARRSTPPPSSAPPSDLRACR